MPAKVKKIHADSQYLHVSLNDGREIRVPLNWYPSLERANAKDLAKWEISGAGRGVYWPQLDYDLSVAGILNGNREHRNVIPSLRKTHAERVVNAPGSNYHVIHRQGEWVVSGSAASLEIARTKTQAEAIGIARAIAREQGSELVIHRRDGAIRDKVSHGRDNNPPRG